MAGEKRPYLGTVGVTTSAQNTTVIAGLVGVSSNEDPSLPLVTAGDSTKSFLMDKMDGTLSALNCSTGDFGGSCGAVMPDNTAMPLAQATRDLVRSWIEQGAKNN